MADISKVTIENITYDVKDAGSVRYVQQQSLITSQKNQARGNISALGSKDSQLSSVVLSTGAVRYDETQSLTDNQKIQARSNIDAQRIISNATANNFTSVDANGQVNDSGYNANDFLRVVPTSWESIKSVVRAGQASLFWSIGDEFTVYSNDLSTNITFQVMHIFQGNQCGALKLHDSNLTNGMILQTKDVIYYSKFPFSPRQAIYKCPSGLAAGTYHFTIGQHSWVSSDINKIVQFTLVNSIPANGQLYVNQAYNASFVGGTISSFSSPASTSVIETVTMSEGSSGTDLGTLTNAINGNFNSCQRALLGNNNWSQSFERQFMNGGVKNWWVAQTGWDRPHSWSSSHDGLIAHLDSNFVNACALVDAVTINNTVCDGGGTYTTTDKFFLPNRIEMYCTAENSSETGIAWDYYKNNSSSQVPHNAADACRVKLEIGTATSRYYWLRTPDTGNAYVTRYVGTTGSLGSSIAVNVSGLAPACIIA